MMRVFLGNDLSRTKCRTEIRNWSNLKQKTRYPSLTSPIRHELVLNFTFFCIRYLPELGHFVLETKCRTTRSLNRKQCWSSIPIGPCLPYLCEEIKRPSGTWLSFHS